MRTLVTFLLAALVLLTAAPASYALPQPSSKVGLSYDYDKYHLVSGSGSQLIGYTGIALTEDEYNSFRFSGHNYEFAFKVGGEILAPESPCFYFQRGGGGRYFLSANCKLYVGQNAGTATAILFDTSTSDLKAAYDYTTNEYALFPYSVDFVEDNAISTSDPLDIASAYGTYREGESAAMIAAAVAPAAMCQPLLFTPEPVNLDLDSLPTAYKICEGYARLGKTPAQVLSAVRAAITLTQWNDYQCSLVGEECQRTPDGVVIPPAAGPVYPDANDTPGQFPARTTADILQLRQPGLAKTDAEKIAEACRAYTERALSYGATLATYEAESACESMPIFAPGNDNPEATEHKREAIFAQPEDVQLTFQNGLIKEKYLARDWFKNDPRCPTPKPVLESGPVSCDEYPFFASVEASSTHSSLKYINSKQNEREGGRYGNFVQACQLTGSTLPPPDPNGFPGLDSGYTGDPFLVIPMSDIPTSRVCGRALGQYTGFGPPALN